MLIVTGGAGFIGSNIIKALNKKGKTDILVVDNLTDGHKFTNLVNCQIADYCDKHDFLTAIKQENLAFTTRIEAILHQGACSVTTEWNGQYMMQNNYEYSKILLEFCQKWRIPFIYASSAAVYGDGNIFKEHPDYEKPLNIYGYSKLLFDQQVRRILSSGKKTAQIIGLRYFNVYGNGEAHKKSMASVAYHFNQQLYRDGFVRLFAGCDGYADGEQRRDFIYVEDVAAVNLWFLDKPDQSGIFNVGTGRCQTFNQVAQAVIAWHQQGHIQYIPFPEHLRGCYQSYTEADITALRAIGYPHPFHTVETGVAAYLNQLNH